MFVGIVLLPLWYLGENEVLLAGGVLRANLEALYGLLKELNAPVAPEVQGVPVRRGLLQSCSSNLWRNVLGALMSALGEGDDITTKRKKSTKMLTRNIEKLLVPQIPGRKGMAR